MYLMLSMKFGAWKHKLQRIFSKEGNRNTFRTDDDSIASQSHQVSEATTLPEVSTNNYPIFEAYSINTDLRDPSHIYLDPYPINGLINFNRRLDTYSSFPFSPYELIESGRTSGEERLLYDSILEVLDLYLD